MVYLRLIRDAFTELFRAGIREMVPELVRLSGENLAGFGPRRDKEMNSLAKSIHQGLERTRRQNMGEDPSRCEEECEDSPLSRHPRWYL